MASRRKKPQADTEDLIVDGPELDEKPTAEQVLDEFFGGTEGDVMCSVYELGGMQHDQRGFLFRFPFFEGMDSAELFERILENHGPGWYELQAKERVGGWRKRQVFQVGTEADRARAAFPKKPDPEKDAPSPSSQVSPELRAILEGQNKVLAALADATMSRREAPTLLDQAKDLAALRDLFTPPQKDTPVGEIFGIVKDVLSLKDELSSADDSSPLSAAMKQLAPAISKAVDRLSETPPPPVAQPAAAPVQNGHGGGVFSMYLEPLFDRLLKHAEGGDPPEQVAAGICDYLATQPEAVESVCLGMVLEERERVVGRLIGSEPKLEPHRQYLERCVSALIKAVEEIDAELEAAQAEPPADASQDPTPTKPAATSPQPAEGASDAGAP